VVATRRVWSQLATLWSVGSQAPYPTWCREYATKCLSAAALVPCLNDRLPTMVALLCTMMEADATTVQRESVKVNDVREATTRCSCCQLVNVPGLPERSDSANMFVRCIRLDQGLSCLLLVFGQSAIDKAADAARDLDTVTDLLGKAKLDVNGDGEARAVEASAASLGRIPRRSVVLLLVDKCLAIMRQAVADRR